MNKRPTPPLPSETSTKETILEVAAQLFADHGVASTSVREICTAAGITAPTLYYHFGSKDGLLRDIIIESLESFLGDVASLELDASLAEALEALALRVFAFGDDRPASVRLIAQLETMPLSDEMRRKTNGLQAQSMASIARLFQRALEKGELINVDPTYCATSFVGLIMMHLAARHQMPPKRRPSVVTAARLLAQFVVGGAKGLSVPTSTASKH